MDRWKDGTLCERARGKGICACARTGWLPVRYGDQVDEEVNARVRTRTRLAEHEDDDPRCQRAPVVAVKPSGGACRDYAAGKTAG